jgi:hypothetical protein
VCLRVAHACYRGCAHAPPHLFTACRCRLARVCEGFDQCLHVRRHAPAHGLVLRIVLQLVAAVAVPASGWRVKTNGQEGCVCVCVCV